MSGRLLLVRHGQSEWNALNLFTGQKDIGLTERGRNEAREAGALLAERGMAPDETHTSVLSRAIDTASIILEVLGCDAPVFRSAALNERDYGDLTGMNKDEARKTWGDEQVHIWRRSYATAPPGGESLRDTFERTGVYYREEILPRLLEGKCLLVVAHGNSLRSLAGFLEDLDEEGIQATNIETGEILLYRLNADGSLAGKENLAPA
ncbi:MAG: 2,3-bisphosphoglycerate-dependent phosphoglycerate mutase [Hyphomicrobiales bacterium]|nr:2,3-bisphosphoglycerate-dependent phosphoglycerate mutase [Hyphomicrobiales bacterium]